MNKVVVFPDGTKCYNWPTCSRHNTKTKITSVDQLRDEFDRRLAEVDAAQVSTVTPLSKQTPTDIDTGLAFLYDQYYRATDRAASLRKEIANNDRYIRQYGNGMSARYRVQDLETANTRLNAKAEKFETEATALLAEMEPGEQEFRRRGGWTRSFLVTNGNGHAHRDRSCSTCRSTTRYAWMTEFSGKNEAEIVDAAGERACTVCYPSAPVSVLSRPTRMFTPQEREAQAAREERARQLAARRAAAAPGLITTPSGQPLIYREYGDRTGGYSRELKTERSAEQAAVDIRYNEKVTEYYNAQGTYARREPDARQLDKNAVIREDYESILVALANKRDQTVDEVLTTVETKAAAKMRRNGF